eukprot:g5228.t1
MVARMFRFLACHIFDDGANLSGATRYSTPCYDFSMFNKGQCMLFPFVLAVPTSNDARDYGRIFRTWDLELLYGAYKPAFWWYELVYVIYRVFMVGMLALVAPGTDGQIAVGIAVEFAGMAALIGLSPHTDPDDGQLALFSHASVLLWLVVSLMQKVSEANSRTHETDATFTAIYLALLVASPLFLVVLLFKERRDADEGAVTISSTAANPVTANGVQNVRKKGESLKDQALRIYRDTGPALAEPDCQRALTTHDKRGTRADSAVTAAI